MVRSILTVIGARPQFVKAGTVSLAIQECSTIEETIVHTGQHHDANMSDVFFADMQIPRPTWNLGIHGGHHGEMTGRMLTAIEKIILQDRPDVVLVYGDTNSTLAGALAASKLGIPVAHVEAGLRSFNKAMPEEINRILTDHVSDLLFCPTEVSVRNLAAEGISGTKVRHVGDVMYDATLHIQSLAKDHSRIIEELGLTRTRYCLATIHRAENTATRDRLTEVFEFLRRMADEEDAVLVLPLHPRTKKVVADWGISLDGMKVIEPLGYFDFHKLLDGAASVLTDSGGVQKEAYFHSVPCVTLREETEWTETIEAGWNRLWTTREYKPRTVITDYGTGRSARDIVNTIAEFLG